MILTTSFHKEMISAKFLWGNVFFGRKLKKDAKNSNFDIFESALYLKSVSMPLTPISYLITFYVMVALSLYSNSMNIMLTV